MGLECVLEPVLAGLALIGAISSNIASAIEAEEHREAAVITFMATASGMSLFGLGAAFWGVVIGCAAYLLLYKTGFVLRRKPQETS